jgi:hypothetical protein
MKLEIGQRWKRVGDIYNNPNYILMIEISLLIGSNAKGIVVQVNNPPSYSNGYNVGQEVPCGMFPPGDATSNSFWMYLEGQDKPT